ncbi:MAG: cobalamin B12-binding domain-containing protein [Armatimonadetes bacterium]|nr:cobalamin B12-binding domain-containing protein [Armatimonadota bacterium]
MARLRIDYVVPDRLRPGSSRRPPMPPMGISLLLAMTPPHLRGYDITARCHDEQTMGPYDVATEKPDILALSALTTSARRAYAMMDLARQTTSWQGRRVRSMIGGIHATALPVEAIHYADAVVRGETPPVLLETALDWLIGQIENDGEERRVFEHCVDARADVIERRPPADRSWYDPRRYIVPVTLQSSVGCPFDCSFCSVTYEFGMKQRHPEYDDLEAEIARLPRGLTAIIDDNFLPNPQGRHARHACELLRRHRVKWVTELTALTLHKNWRELLPLFARSGCIGLYVGIESLEGGMDKSADLATYEDLVNCIHDHGMGALGAFVFGVHDSDGPDVFEKTAAWARKAKFDFAQFSINTPEPGARDYERAVRENLLTDWNWEHYDTEHPVRRFTKITQEQMYQGLRNAYRWFYGLPSLKDRMLGQVMDMFLKGSPSVGTREFLWKRVKSIAVFASIGLYLRNTAMGWSNRSDVAAYNADVDPTPNPFVMRQFGPGSVVDQYDAKLRMKELRGEVANRTRLVLGDGIPLTLTGRPLAQTAAGG